MFIATRATTGSQLKVRKRNPEQARRTQKERLRRAVERADIVHDQLSAKVNKSMGKLKNVKERRKDWGDVNSSVPTRPPWHLFSLPGKDAIERMEPSERASAAKTKGNIFEALTLNEDRQEDGPVVSFGTEVYDIPIREIRRSSDGGMTDNSREENILGEGKKEDILKHSTRSPVPDVDDEIL